MDEKEKIDFVLPWVDGADPKWLAEKRKWEGAGAAMARGDEDANADCRYRDCGLLKYWFRAVEKFAPWVNRVFFVTCGQKPDWLDESNPKLRLVNHADYIPADGVILAETEYEIEEGDTVFDILTEAARQYRIQVETAGRWNMIYVAGINYLYELDFGDLSGWIYHVNGFAPPVGCGEYVLEDGDKIEWLYSCDIGNDLRD